jgi:ribose 5-phosphate isomerase A
MFSEDLVESAKKAAAYAAVDEFVKDGMVVGIGSGSTIVYAMQRIVEKVKSENLRIVCIASSFQSQYLIEDAKLNLETLNRYPEVSKYVLICGLKSTSYP